MAGKYLAIAGRACLIIGVLLLAVAALYAGQFTPSPDYAPSSSRGRQLLNLVRNLVWLARTDRQGRILVLAAGGILLMGAVFLLLSKGKGSR